ncbi:hypothetical protein SALBM311S_11621 [Streptomyces alboniger]
MAEVSASHPETTSRCMARTPEPRCQQLSTKAAPPASTMKPAYDMYRPKPYSQPTTPPPAVPPDTATDVEEGAPTEKV